LGHQPAIQPHRQGFGVVEREQLTLAFAEAGHGMKRRAGLLAGGRIFVHRIAYYSVMACSKAGARSRCRYQGSNAAQATCRLARIPEANSNALRSCEQSNRLRLHLPRHPWPSAIPATERRDGIHLTIINCEAHLTSGSRRADPTSTLTTTAKNGKV